jgi:putative FmdB family regulatory protein
LGGDGFVPLYEYQCSRCGRFEVIQKFSDAALVACPTCGEGVTKLLSAPAIQFKGTGWYITDYARKSKGDGAAKGDSPGSKSQDAGAPRGTGSSPDKASSSDSGSPPTSTSKDGAAAGGSRSSK